VPEATQNPTSFAKRLTLRIENWSSLHEKLLRWLVASGLLVIYLAFPTQNYYWDGISFAQTIEDAKYLKNLIHPNHLIYNLIGYWFYHLLHSVGFTVRAITALQVMNAILSATAAVILFFTLRKLFSLYLTTFLTLLNGFSATWWKYSSDADAYIISNLFILITLYFILPDRKSRPFLVSILFTLSMCFHQLAIFFGPVIILALIIKSRKLVPVLQFALTTSVLTTATYVYCFYITDNPMELGRFLRWITSFSPDASFTFNFWNNLAYTLRGHARLFLNGRFNLLKGLVNPFIIALIGVLIISFCLFCYFVARNFKKPNLATVRRLIDDPQSKPVLTLAVTWVLVYLIFLFVWLPQNTFYRLFYLPALILLLGLFASARYEVGKYRQTYRLASLTVAVALANFLFFIYPYSHSNKFPPTQFALELGQRWPAGTVVFFDLENSDKSLVRYFSPATRWVQLKSHEPEALDEKLKDVYAQGSTAWLETTTIARLAATPAGKLWLDTHAKTDSRFELMEKGFRIQFIQVMP
jgi:hypothetical protein